MHQQTLLTYRQIFAHWLMDLPDDVSFESVYVLNFDRNI